MFIEKLNKSDEAVDLLERIRNFKPKQSYLEIYTEKQQLKMKNKTDTKLFDALNNIK